MRQIWVWNVSMYAGVYMYVHACVSLEVYISMRNRAIFFFLWISVLSSLQLFQEVLSCSLVSFSCFSRLMCKIIDTSISLVLISSKSQRKFNLICCNYLGIFFPKYTSSQKKGTWLLLFLTAGRWNSTDCSSNVYSCQTQALSWSYGLAYVHFA